MQKLKKLAQISSSHGKHTLLMLLPLILGITLGTAVRVDAQSTEVRVVNPQTDGSDFEFYTNTTFVGARINVTLFVDNVDDLLAFQVQLYYDSAFLNATRAWIPVADPSYVFNGRSTVPVSIFYYDDPNYGDSVCVGDTIVVGDTFYGSGLLAIIEFEITFAPTAGKVSCNLDIDNEDTYLLDFNLDEITTVKTAGHYEYTWVERFLPYLEAKPNRYKATKPEAFNIAVWINNTVSGDRLVNITFRLGYDATLLDVTQVIEGPFLELFGNATFNYTHEAGNLTVSTYLEPPHTSYPEGDGTIATVTFQGIYQDNKEHTCDLKLSEIEFLDDEKNPIPSSPPIHSSYRILPSTSQITINMPEEVTAGSNVTISGNITPTKASVEVTIHYRPLGKTDWAILSTAVTDVSSHYEYIWKANRTYEAINYDYFEFYANWSGDSSTLGAESEIVSSVRILPPSSTISIEAEPGTFVLVGNNVTIKGDIEPKRVNVSVTIEYRPAGEANWTLLATVQTDSQSRYNYTWVTPELGTYELKASWEGDEITIGDTSDIMTVDIVSLWIFYLPYILGGIGIVIVAAIVILYFKKFRKS